MRVRKRKFIFRIIAVLSGFIGVAVLSSVIYSLVSYDVISKDKFPTLLNPVVEKSNLDDNVYDYTKASNWFVGSDKSKFDETKVSYYNISIPKLKIESAIVAIGGDDLSAHLIQYPGTALPGKRGNSVIFGHSTLPSFFNPKNYTSIFSTLSILNPGDEIIVYYDGVEYRYKVETLLEVRPTDVEVLEQNISDSYLTLVTCTPPGDPRKPRRLIVRAKIVPLGS
jgi:sortase A